MSIKYNKLPNRLFRVKVPRIATYTEIELEIMGTPIVEDCYGNTTEADSDMVIVHLPLTRIIDIYSMGMRISLLDPKETADLYNILEEYLTNTTPFQNTFNMPRYEENRDLDIDKFAEEMFNINRDNIVHNTVNKRSGFDLGLERLVVRPVTKSTGRRSRGSVTSSYLEQNPTTAFGGTEAVLTDGRDIVNPDTVTRKNKVRRRRKRIKSKEL